MTEAEWLASVSPVAMFRHLGADPCDRKVLLYASHLCQQRPKLLTDDLKAWAVVVEKVLDSGASKKAAENAFSAGAVQEAAELEVSVLQRRGPPGRRAYYSALSDVVFFIWYDAPEEYETDIPAGQLKPVRRANAAVVRDLYGNLFRKVKFHKKWRTSTAVAIAKGMYESRDFGAMPILADALQDAGCDDEDVLNHCRDAKQVHVRGCWVVDLVLGKA